MQSTTLPNGERARCAKVAKMAWDDGAGTEVDRRAKELMAKSSFGYSEAMHRVLAADEHLKHSYASEGWRRPEAAVVDRVDGESPSMKVHKLTQANMRATGRRYSEAMTAVLNDPNNRDLKTAFARCA